MALELAMALAVVLVLIVGGVVVLMVLETWPADALGTLVHRPFACEVSGFIFMRRCDPSAAFNFLPEDKPRCINLVKLPILSSSGPLAVSLPPRTVGAGRWRRTESHTMPCRSQPRPQKGRPNRTTSQPEAPNS